MTVVADPGQLAVVAGPGCRFVSQCGMPAGDAPVDTLSSGRDERPPGPRRSRAIAVLLAVGLLVTAAVVLDRRMTASPEPAAVQPTAPAPATSSTPVPQTTPSAASRAPAQVTTDLRTTVSVANVRFARTGAGRAQELVTHRLQSWPSPASYWLTAGPAGAHHRAVGVTVHFDQRLDPPDEASLAAALADLPGARVSVSTAPGTTAEVSVPAPPGAPCRGSEPDEHALRLRKQDLDVVAAALRVFGLGVDGGRARVSYHGPAVGRTRLARVGVALVHACAAPTGSVTITRYVGP